MKTQITLFLIFVSTFSFSQNQNKIDLEKLKTKVYQLVNEERSNNDRKVLGLDAHLKNILDHQYFYTEIGFSVDWENKKIYAVQMFGAK